MLWLILAYLGILIATHYARTNNKCIPWVSRYQDSWWYSGDR